MICIPGPKECGFHPPKCGPELGKGGLQGERLRLLKLLLEFFISSTAKAEASKAKAN